MDAQSKTVECTVGITITGETKNIRIRHKEKLEDARIRVDDKSVEVKSQKMPSGVALYFEQDGAKVTVTIIKENDEYLYDCFVNEVSVKDGMPWKMGKYELPEILKWKSVLEKGLGKYTLIEALRGVIVGLFIFLFLVVLKLLLPNLLQSINLVIYFFISVFPLAIFYALLSPGEFKAGEKSLKEYNSYRGENVEEVIPQEETKTEETTDDILPDVEDITE